MAIKMINLEIGAVDAGLKLLDFISRELHLSKKRAKQLLDTRVVLVNRRRVWMARHVLRAGDVVTTPSATIPHPASMDVGVLWRDARLAVVNKPANLITTGDDSLETLIRSIFSDSGWRAVHRLDRDTSGCVICAADPAAFAAMITLFKNHALTKIYHAIVSGRWPARFKRLTHPINGRTALSEVHLLDSSRAASHVTVAIMTGRTHQVRLHLANAGHPVLGDRRYGLHHSIEMHIGPVPRQMLHAQHVSFAHPFTQVPLKVSAPLPADFRDMLRFLGLH